MKDVSGFKPSTILFIAMMIGCSMLLSGCFGDNNSNSSSNSNISVSPITPVGALSTCLTVNSPTLGKLTDGQYKLVDEINNCGGKNAGPLKITAQITAGTTMQSANLIGPVMIGPNGKAMYSSSGGQKGQTKKEIHLQTLVSKSALVTILVTINGSMQGEWDGQVTIPT